MPVRFVRPNLGYNQLEIVDELAYEWRNDASSTEAPLILVEQDPAASTGPIHLVVVWDKWREVPGDDRSTLIMQAFARTHPDQVRRVTIAMGVTKAEALTMGLPTE